MILIGIRLRRPLVGGMVRILRSLGYFADRPGVVSAAGRGFGMSNCPRRGRFGAANGPSATLTPLRRNLLQADDCPGATPERRRNDTTTKYGSGRQPFVSVLERLPIESNVPFWVRFR